MAEVVKGLGIGGQTLVERELGWNRRTIRFMDAGVGEWQAFLTSSIAGCANNY
ncbi:hypothetical protein ABF638_32710 [Nostoc sp. CALU 1950]